MNIPDTQTITLRLEVLKLANGDVVLAQTMLNFLLGDSINDTVKDLRAQLTVLELANNSLEVVKG